MATSRRAAALKRRRRVGGQGIALGNALPFSLVRIVRPGVEPGVLELELEPLLRARGTRYVLERTLIFGDLAWDPDATSREVLHQDWAIIIDASMGNHAQARGLGRDVGAVAEE